MGSEGPLAGCRVLVIEDEYFIGADLSRALHATGAEVVGPCGTLADARETAEREQFAAAVLDLNLHGEMTFSLADDLVRWGVPFVFATGYSSEWIPARFEGVRRWEKPFNQEQVVGDLVQIWDTRRLAAT